VLTNAAAATVSAPGPPPVVLTDAAAAAVFAFAPLPLMLAEAAATLHFLLHAAVQALRRRFWGW